MAKLRSLSMFLLVVTVITSLRNNHKCEAGRNILQLPVTPLSQGQNATKDLPKICLRGGPDTFLDTIKHMMQLASEAAVELPKSENLDLDLDLDKVEVGEVEEGRVEVTTNQIITIFLELQKLCKFELTKEFQSQLAVVLAGIPNLQTNLISLNRELQKFIDDLTRK